MDFLKPYSLCHHIFIIEFHFEGSLRIRCFVPGQIGR